MWHKFCPRSDKKQKKKKQRPIVVFTSKIVWKGWFTRYQACSEPHTFKKKRPDFFILAFHLDRELNLIFLCSLWAFKHQIGERNLFGRQNCRLYIATDDSREHQTCVQITTNLKHRYSSSTMNAILCSVLPIQSCSLWHFIIPLLLFYIFKQ